MMAYDIYGNHLRRGYCEVHPDIHEEYPCSECSYQYDYYEATREPEIPDPRVEEYENDMLRQMMFDLLGIDANIKLLKQF